MIKVVVSHPYMVIDTRNIFLQIILIFVNLIIYTYGCLLHLLVVLIRIGGLVSLLGFGPGRKLSYGGRLGRLWLKGEFVVGDPGLCPTVCYFGSIGWIKSLAAISCVSRWNLMPKLMIILLPHSSDLHLDIFYPLFPPIICGEVQWSIWLKLFKY